MLVMHMASTVPPKKIAIGTNNSTGMLISSFNPGTEKAGICKVYANPLLYAIHAGIGFDDGQVRLYLNPLIHLE